MKQVTYAGLIVGLFIGVGSIVGCTDLTTAEINSYGSKHLVTLYSSSGTVIRQWHTDGKVSSPNGSDGYVFMSKETGKMVQVTGTIVVDTL